MPETEWGKPEMRAFIEGRDTRSRTHLEATAKALSGAWEAGATKERERLKKQLKAAERLYLVWGMLVFWASEDSRHIEWGRYKKAGKGAGDGYCVWASEGDRNIATVQGRDANHTAERLAVKLKLVEPGELL